MQADDHRFSFVAADAKSGVVGFVIGGPSREDDPAFMGELYAIYLLEAFQGGGSVAGYSLALGRCWPSKGWI